MLFELLDLPAGAPASLNLLVVALVVLALQAFPLTGIFLMILGGPLWAGVLITLTMFGTMLEVATGQASPGWLALPGLYFGTYYLLVGWNRMTIRQIARELADFNAGQSLAFDPARQDLVLVKGRSDVNMGHALLTDYALPRLFDEGRVHFVGTPEACELAKSVAARQSGVYSQFESRTTFKRFRKGAQAPEPPPEGGIITAPGEPERPVVSVTSHRDRRRDDLVPLQVTDFTLRDEASGAHCDLRIALTSPLARFPFPVIGFALNSGSPSWKGIADWMRPRARLLGSETPDGREVVAAALGLAPSTGLAARAVGAEAVAAMIAQADAARTGEALAALEEMLADPLTNIGSGSLDHLTIRPGLVVPHADRIVAALGRLQTSDLKASANGRALWRLMAVLPDEVFARHRTQIVRWLEPGTARPWTRNSDRIYPRLDAAVPAEREILLHRLETERGDLKSSLLPGFARMGTAAPPEVKARLLAIWHARAPDPASKGSHRSDFEAVLYFTLARMGLKGEAGEVVQRYWRDTYAAIWREVEADSHPELCDASPRTLDNHFRKS
ncbi:MAG: hypothetical protein NBV68_16595 [Erythrobacter sp.]|uniref:hypothetical protein n=1 Tax=Erythrobacter sp. TaxID=1042 RepID=UPI0025DC07D1|nr:hypothetical protein [Erythrobacter sp.]MCM0000997.1 hypothetical protein [Erythrobacter sp.]